MNHPFIIRSVTSLQHSFHFAALLAITVASAASPLSAQAARTDFLQPPAAIEVRVEASSPDVVKVIVGLELIHAQLELGLLLIDDSLANPEVSHFRIPREQILPEIKDSLAAAGAPDLEPLLKVLEGAADKEAVTAAFSAVEGALLISHGKIERTAADELLAVHEMVAVAASKINAEGPTEVADYQEAWAIILAARGELEYLRRDSDPTIAKLAADEAMLFDELIISLPDPDQAAPVTFDAGLFNDLASRLDSMNQEA